MPTATPAPASPAPPGPPIGGQLARGTLGRQLVVRVVVLVAAVAILLGTATTVVVHQLLLQSRDDQLTAVTNRQQSGPRPSERDQPPGGIDLPGQPVGTLVVIFHDARPAGADGNLASGGILTEDLGIGPVPRTVGVTLAAEVEPGRPDTVALPEFGRYRMLAHYDGDDLVAIGLPLAEIDQTLFKVVALEVALSGAAMLIAALVARELIVTSLRPLNRVAATAQQVSTLPLATGDVDVSVRVPAADANPTSEVGRVGQAFNHMLSHVSGALTARQASETKVRRFVADASHELRNPLAAIRGYAELTRRNREELPPQAAHAVDRIGSEADRMTRLVEDLLLLARLDSGPGLDLAPVDLTETVINAVGDARAAGPDHRWTLQLPPEPITAIGDGHRLHQVLANLLANARTHTPAGTTVEAGLAVDGADVLLTVADDGPGIPPDLQGQVFDRFAKGDPSRTRRAHDSTGLGLSIVAAVVDAHHGTVTVDSRPGHTRFVVRLPRDPRG